MRGSRLLAAVSLLGATLVASGVLAAAAEPRPATPAVDAIQLARLIDALADADVAVREAATERLERIGYDARATLRAAAEPDEPAFVDTSAEIQFVLGRRDEAVRLQERAVALAPDVAVLKERLERFRTAPLPATRPARP